MTRLTLFLLTVVQISHAFVALPPRHQAQASSSLRSTRLDPEVARSLDLPQILELISDYARTVRGKNAILSAVAPSAPSPRLSRQGSTMNAKRRRASTSISAKPSLPTHRLAFASTREEAIREYDLVEQAQLVVSGSCNVSHPIPWADSGGTDDDEWLLMSPDEYSLENLLQVEQVLRLILSVCDWGRRDDITQWCPHLAGLTSTIPEDRMRSLYTRVEGQVKYVRVQNAMDVSGKSSFMFQLSGEKNPVLGILRSHLDGTGKKNRVELEEEIALKEQDILYGLALEVVQYVNDVNAALNVIAELDSLLARASFGASHCGQRPCILAKGCIDIKGFRHPLLQSSLSNHAPVPVDLSLGADENSRALIVSGPNGGGKTVALKSFGIVSILSRLGIPLPSEGHCRVDFFSEVLSFIGDEQSIDEGTSTFIATLQKYSQLIERLNEAGASSTLILMDEFGSGTEAESGGAIAQAILEKVLSNEHVGVVATTHSNRLKAFAFDNLHVRSAAVQLEATSSAEEYKRPSFSLQYDVIGDSYALGAASRCLPPSVVARASSLLADESSSSRYLEALAESLELQIDRAKRDNAVLEGLVTDASRCRSAMKSMAAVYEDHLTKLLDRTENTYQRLKGDGAGELELLGSTISELKVARKQVRSEAELLRERGLKILPSSYRLSIGESVVIVAPGAWDGTTAKVIEISSTRQQVSVLPALDPWADMIPGHESGVSSQPMVFQRHELAIWDYDSVWEENNDDEARSIPDARRRLQSVLSSLESSPKPTTTGPSPPKNAPPKSSRERKARKRKR